MSDAVRETVLKTCEDFLELLGKRGFRQVTDGCCDVAAARISIRMTCLRTRRSAVPHFEMGALLYLAVHAEIIWLDKAQAKAAGRERGVSYRGDQVRRGTATMPFI